MNAKENLIYNIREWVNIDNEMRTLKDELNKRKRQKDILSAELINIMKEQNIDSVDINNGQIEYSKKNIKKPITKKILLNILSKFYKGDEEKTIELNNFILENRQEVVKETITRKVTK